MAIDIGIDLGTTNSVVAYENVRGRAEVVINAANERSTKSVVGLDGKGNVLVGSVAEEQAGLRPKNTIFSVKRLMGRYFDDPNVRAVQSRFRYQIVKSPSGDEVHLKLGDRVLSPIDISALILRKLKEDTEYRLGEPVTHAVITVPAYFSINQRMATRTAGEMAGLRVKTIINEPTAAAMAFGVERDPGAQRYVLVYDLGGGTFDISLLFVAGEVYTQLGIEGDMWLGGDDFDHAIERHVLKSIERECHVDPSSDDRFMLLLKRQAEKAKIRLSEMLTTSIVIESSFTLPDGQRGDVDLELTRRTFEDLAVTDGAIRVEGVDVDTLRCWCSELDIDGVYGERSVEFSDTVRNRVKKSLLLTNKAILEAGVSREQLDHVLLVGGSTGLPLVQQMLEAQFGRERIMRQINPMECVGLGAGIAARRIQHIVCQAMVKDTAGEEKPCGEANDRDASKCRRCDATLRPGQPCPECGCWNSFDAKQCVNPAGCVHEFRVITANNVLAKPVGILTEVGAYEVIVPKGLAYPTAEPVVMSFRTARHSKHAVRIPIFHAEVAEFDPKDRNQWIGAADIKLDGILLPADTAVDVSVGVDSDGILDIRAIVQDGSGRNVHVVVDPSPGLGVPDVPDDGGANREWGHAGDESQATGAPALEKWRTDLMWSVTWARIALDSYEWFFRSPETTKTLRRLIEKGARLATEDDEQAARRVEHEIDSTLNEEFGGLMILLWAEMRVLNREIPPDLRGRLSSLIKGLGDMLRQGASVEAIRKAVDELDVALAEAGSAAARFAQDNRDGDTKLRK